MKPNYSIWQHTTGSLEVTQRAGVQCKKSWQMVANQLLSHQTLSRDTFLFCFERQPIDAIHLLGRWHFYLYLCIYKNQMSFPPQKPKHVFESTRSQPEGGGGRVKATVWLINHKHVKEWAAIEPVPRQGARSVSSGKTSLEHSIFILGHRAQTACFLAL